MLTALASLVFLAAAIAAAAVIRITLTGFRDVALANIAALRQVEERRDYRFARIAIVRAPAPVQALRRKPSRTVFAPVRILPPQRAAA